MRSRDFNKKKKFYPEFKKGLKNGRLTVVAGICVGALAGLIYGAYTAYEVYGLVAGGTVALSAVTAGLGAAGIVAGMTSFAVSGLIGDGEFLNDLHSIKQTSFAKVLGRNLVSLTALGVLVGAGVKAVAYSAAIFDDARRVRTEENHPKTGLNIECKDKFKVAGMRKAVASEVKTSLLLPNRNTIVNSPKI